MAVFEDEDEWCSAPTLSYSVGAEERDGTIRLISANDLTGVSKFPAPDLAWTELGSWVGWMWFRWQWFKQSTPNGGSGR